MAIDRTDVLRKAEKPGAAHNLALGGCSAGRFHVAACRELVSHTFLTFGDKQTAMALAAGLTLIP